jgi:hypothetical protein
MAKQYGGLYTVVPGSKTDTLATLHGTGSPNISPAPRKKLGRRQGSDLQHGKATQRQKVSFKIRMIKKQYISLIEKHRVIKNEHGTAIRTEKCQKNLKTVSAYPEPMRKLLNSKFWPKSKKRKIFPMS